VERLGHRVLKNTTAYLLAGLLPYLTRMITLPLFTRFMEPSEYGILSLVQAFNAMFIVFLGLQLTSSIIVYYFDYKDRDLKTFCSTIFWSIVIIPTIIIGLVFLVGESFSMLVFPSGNVPFYPYLMLILITAFFSQISGFGTVILRVQQKGTSILKISVFTTIIQLILSIWLVVGERLGAYGVLLAGLIGGGIQSLVIIFTIRSHIIPVFRGIMFRTALKYSLPIIPHHIGGFLFIYSDKIILEKFVTLSAIGLYGIAVTFANLLRLVVMSANQALQPNFMEMSKNDRKIATSAFKPIITKWAILVSLCFLVLAVFSKEAIMLLTPAKFYSASAYIPILLLAHVFRGMYLFPINSILFLKKTIYVPVITLTAGLLNVILNLIFIPKYGVIAAAWTTLVSSALTFLLAFLISKRYYMLEYEYFKLIEIGFITMVAFGISQNIPTSNLLVAILLKSVVIFAVIVYYSMRGDYNIIRDIKKIYKV